MLFSFSKFTSLWSQRLLVETVTYVLILFFRYLAELCGIGTAALGISGGAGASFPTVIINFDVFMFGLGYNINILQNQVGFYIK